MAISTVSLLNEAEYLRDRICKATSGSEARHYEEKLCRLESEMRSGRYDINTDSYVDTRGMRQYALAANTVPIPNPTPIPEPQTPLSFLKSADKKLLLTGATS